MKKIKNVFRYLHYTFGLLKLNIGTLLVFELLYKFASMAVFKPLLTGVMKLALKAQGLSYLSDETIGTFIRSPLTWFFLLLIVLGMAFFTLFDICCIITCIHASFRKQAMPLLALMRKGLKTSLRVIYQRNIVMILYLLIIIPMTHALVISGYITKFTVPQFIVDYIMTHTWLAILYIGFWIYIGLRSFHWIYSLHYFCLENCNFKQARKRSWKLQENHYWTDLIIVLGWSAACIGIYYGVILVGSWLVSRVNQALPTQDLFSSLTLSGISLLMDVCGALFFCFDLPLFFICISLLFYYRKAAAGERIPRVFRDLDNAYRITNTRWVKKIYVYRKRIIALSIVVVIGVNFAYNFADRRGVLHMGLGNPVEVTAHRGYSAAYPENTIPAFKGAIQVGADWAELDVQQTADGEVIVMHDSNLKRTTGLDKEVWQVTWDEIKDLDNGSWFDKKYQTVRIPTLEEVLKVCRGKIHLNIEIKPSGHDKDLEEQVAKLLKKYHMRDTCVVSSLKYDSLRKIKEADDSIETAYITSVSYGNFTDLEYADGYSVESTLLSKSFVNKAQKAGKQIYVWTVNSEERLEKVVGMGIDNVITDDPVMAKELIYEQEHSTFWDRYVKQLLQIGK
ncbi:glycerophosphodiester phosphodiesterase family protein [Eubacterium ramulus]|uniref:Glycerophosphodiester phosphodiesterase family protein n=1 Tax=Eubacterium ramulus ATCC 29099 TaxID=1256908 RepID=U2QK03_EUBRA|nr:glycerophosphodiester phosphodiesterase [Eubacterium ramulus]ERK41628.1 glycerophosphodiester phosphodiesterase family protein [Eubacterium ramulus ATCC 29099]